MPPRPDPTRRLSLVGLALLVAGCGSVAPSPTPTASDAPTSEPSESVGASASEQPTRGPASDLGLLLRTLEGTHPEPFHATTRAAFMAALEQYEANLPSMTPAESAVELMRIWATLATERDGHQFALPTGEADRILPIRVYEFEGELWITDALPPHEGLVGSRIMAIGETPAEGVMALVEPLVPRDGPATVAAFRPILLLRTVVLEGLGVVDDGAGPIEIATEAPDGEDATATLEPISSDEHSDWAGPFGLHTLPLDAEVTYLADAEPFAVHRLDDGRTLYLRYRQVAPPSTDEAEALIGAGGVDRLILDLRQNPGGNNTTSGPLLRLVQSFAADHPGATFVLTDRVTFSAAANLATEIEGSTDAIFMGEPMGGGLNFWDDVSFVLLRTLPIPMRMSVSTRYWQMAEPDDPRLTIEPDDAFPVTIADYLARRDPVLEAALAR